MNYSKYSKGQLFARLLVNKAFVMCLSLNICDSLCKYILIYT